MGSENLKALEEIKALGHQVDLAGDLADLEPIRQRLEQVAGEYSGRSGGAKSRRGDQAAAAEPGDPADARRHPLPPFQAVARRSGRVRPPSTSRRRPFRRACSPRPDRPRRPSRRPSEHAQTHGMEARSVDGHGGGRGAFADPDRGAGECRAQAQRESVGPDRGSTDVAVQIATTPPGASIRVNGEDKCTSDCKLTLAPGAYQITAFLDGYEPAASGVNLVLGKPETLNLTLEARPQTVRILSDLAQGKVVLDGQPPVDLQDGQYVFEKVPPGTHTVSVTGSERGGVLQFRSGARQAAGGERNREREKCAGDAGIELRRARPPGDQFGSLEAGRQRTSRRTTPVPPAWT